MTTETTTIESIVRHLAGADRDLVLTVKRAKSAYTHMLRAYGASVAHRTFGDEEAEREYEDIATEYGRIYQYRIEKAAGRVNDLTGIDEAFAASVIVSIVEG